MAREETLAIKFEAKGSKALQQAINRISVATKMLTKTQKQYEAAITGLAGKQKKTVDQMFAIQTATRNTGHAFSVLRSKMLLVSFAFLIIGNSIGKLVKAASKFEEMMNKANVVFGKQIGLVKQWGTVLGNTVGRATSELIEMASVLQDTFVPLGFTREAATELSTSLTELIVDVASFNNKLDADVARDFQSAIVGNHETVRKYGIIITEARLKQEGHTLGLIKGNQILNAQQKVLARLSLIQKGSSDALGDAVRTSGSFENQMKALNAELMESAIFFGDLIKKVLEANIVFGQFNVIDVAKFAAQKESIGSMGATIAIVGAMMLRTAAKSKKLFNVLKGLFGFVATKTPWGVYSLLIFGVLRTMAGFISSSKEKEVTLKSVTEQIKEQSKAVGLLTAENEKYVPSVVKSITSLEKKLGATQGLTAAQRYQATVAHELTNRERVLIDKIHAQNKALKEETKLRSKLASFRKKDVRSKVENMAKDIAGMEAIIRKQEMIVKAVEDEAAARLEQHTLTEERNQDIAKIADKTANVMLDQEKQIIRVTDLVSFLTGKVKDNILLSDEEYSAEAALLEQYILNLEKIKLEYKKLKAELIDEDKFGILGDEIATALEKIAGAIDVDSFQFDAIAESMTAVKDLAIELQTETEGAYLNFAANIGAAFIAMQEQVADARIATAKEEANAQIAALREQFSYRYASQAEQERQEKEIRDKANDNIRKEFKIKRELAYADATMNYGVALMKVWSQTGIFAPAFTGVLSALYLAQIKAIDDMKAPTMRYGGLIGGQRHEQGGTMIEAERGEFVMRREAVDSIGIETMNRINEGDAFGSINISFNGNVLSKDFIEDEAIPQIKEAIRRGADIGVG